MSARFRMRGILRGSSLRGSTPQITPQLPRKMNILKFCTRRTPQKRRDRHAFGQGGFAQTFYVRYGFFVPKSSHIEHKMSGQPAPGRTHGRNIRFCGVGYPCGVLLRGICGVFAGFEPRRDEPRKIPRIRNRAAEARELEVCPRTYCARTRRPIFS